MKEKRGKNWFIRAMAAEILRKRMQDVTEAQYKASKELFLAMAYDSTEDRLNMLRTKLRNC